MISRAHKQCHMICKRVQKQQYFSNKISQQEVLENAPFPSAIDHVAQYNNVYCVWSVVYRAAD